MGGNGAPGLRLKSIRIDDERGEFLGQIGFDPYIRSGLHQHQGVATSFILEGGLTDYHGHVNLHEMGINYRGSTHDAISYVPTVLVSKLEGPVTYPPEEQAAERRPRRLDVPELPQSRPRHPARDQRAGGPRAGRRERHLRPARQPIYDYAGSSLVRRLLQWKLRPETEVPAWQASDWVELWIRGGEIAINGQKAFANCFVVIEPGATVRIGSPFGALALVWAEGREACRQRRNLFGF